ncbi:uncharacterized protein LOC142233715 isoform X2 [Haematobia irritans]
MKPTVGVEKIPTDDIETNAISVKTTPQPQVNAIEKSRQIIENIEAEYSSEISNESKNEDYFYKVNTNSKTVNSDNLESGESYIMDNDYTPQSTIMDFDYSTSSGESQKEEDPDITEACLRCLCKTVNNCNPTKCSGIDPCGIYMISQLYWIDGGRHITRDTTNDYDEINQDFIDYLRCVNNEKCATETVKGYMKRYKRDCNDDGIIDCRDYIALHLMGPSGCRTKELLAIQKVRMNSCLP